MCIRDSPSCLHQTSGRSCPRSTARTRRPSPRGGRPPGQLQDSPRCEQAPGSRSSRRNADWG
eukprot:13255572-Alexandrium_andersonii.AAC.1